MIEIVPAIDIMGGRCVRLTKGDYTSTKVYDASPLDMSLQYADSGVRRIHMVDLDGASEARPINLHTLEQIAVRSGLEIEWGGGIADADALKSAFDAGATQTIVGSVAALKPELFRAWLLGFGAEKILLGSDVRNETVAVKGWRECAALTVSEQINLFLPNGLKYVICTDISRDGMLQGPSFELYRRLQEEFPQVVFTASGGISSMDDIVRLDELGMPKVIVGKAIYEGRISLEDIRKWSLNG
ncbi:MAG: 1-(5-phosphoribosyl)-5-[(5-phosphoribosylamino)methylideneamino]imidazole-4-carboxamide isomerase [Alistipes sp.]|nr:1-(5-phosphoribosyl)-5-[(5-phosphoribosylamino)methylideneamino]imidazole-4-carboxamide isomerase [Candidatus Minthomonas equi]